MRRNHWLALFALTASTIALSGRCLGEAIQPERSMPPDATIYMEIQHPQTLLDQAFDGPLLALVNRSGKLRKYYESGDFRQLKTAIGLIETRLGRKWPQLARELAGSLHVAYHLPSQTSLIVLRPDRAETLTEVHQALVDLVKLDATSKGKESAFASTEYEGITTWSFGPQDHHAITGGLLIQSNQAAGLQAALDRMADPDLPALAEAGWFQQARSSAGERTVGWSVVCWDELRQIPKLAKALDAKSKNPGGELVGGGIMDASRSASRLVSTLKREQGVWRLQAKLDLAGDLSAARDWFFPTPTGNSPPQLDLPHMLLSLSTYRDVAGMWQARDELFDEETTAKLAQADTNLGLYFAGLDFGTQILSEIGPHWQLAIARQQYEPGQPVPAVKLPALAFVLELKNRDRFGTTLLVSFQKTIGLINLVGGQQGQQQLLLASENYRGVSISKATYLFDDETEMHAAPIYYNASPSCALADDYFIFGTTTEIVRQTIDQLKLPRQAGAAPANTQVRVNLAEIATALDDNRALLVSQNVLKEGNSTGQAEQEIGMVLDLLRLAQAAEVKLDKQPQRLVLEATLGDEQ